MKKLIQILTGLAVICFSTSLFAQSKDFVIVESDHQHDLNPHTTTFSTDAQILTGLYEGLFSYNPVTLDPQYAICKDYRISRDKKRISFVLRQDAKFSNGEIIDAEAVRSSWLQLLSTPDAPYATMFDIVRGAQDFRLGKGKEENVGIYVTDKFTLSVYLNTPANYLPKILCHSAFSVVHRIPTVYSGAFQLEDKKPGILFLTKNPYYWDFTNVPSDTITFIQSDNADDNAFYFNTGMADWVSADVDADKILDKKAFQMSGEFATSYYFFKTSAKKNKKAEFNPWDYDEFRNAIIEAMPWDTLREGAMVPAPTLVFPIGDYPALDGFAYTDLIEAKTLMKDARKKYGIPEDKLIPLTFDVAEYSISEAKKEVLVKNCAELGVKLEFNTLPSSIYFNNVTRSNSDLFVYTWIGDFADPLAFLMLFQGDSNLNDSGWKNEEYDSLLLQAAAAEDSQRSAILARAEKILLDSGMIIPIYHPISFNVIDLEEAGGWSTNAFDLHPLKYLYRKVPSKADPNIVKK